MRSPGWAKALWARCWYASLAERFEISARLSPESLSSETLSSETRDPLGQARHIQGSQQYGVRTARVEPCPHIWKVHQQSDAQRDVPQAWGAAGKKPAVQPLQFLKPASPHTRSKLSMFHTYYTQTAAKKSQNNSDLIGRTLLYSPYCTELTVRSTRPRIASPNCSRRSRREPPRRLPDFR